uniref:Fibroin-like protein n=1 Tax=Oryza sativa subsp. japonica TaxID=39947 RepID=Q7Y1D8_ORYSJ|nr:fibroin-like protein [Oryza sativa Japonica Group]
MPRDMWIRRGGVGEDPWASWHSQVGPTAEVAATQAREREAELARIGRLTAAERRRRTAVNRSGRQAPAAGGGEGELIPRLGSGRRRATTAGGGGQSRRHADVAAREKSEGRAGSGLAEPPGKVQGDTGRVAAQGIGERKADSGGLRRRALAGGGAPRRASVDGGLRERATMAARPCQAAARPGTASTRIREASRATTRAKEVRGRAVANGGGHGAACDKGKWFGGELTNEINGVGGADGVAARWTRRRGGAAPRVHGRGRREGEVAMGSLELLVTRPRTHWLLRCSVADGEGESGASNNNGAAVETDLAVERSAAVTGDARAADDEDAKSGEGVKVGAANWRTGVSVSASKRKRTGAGERESSRQAAGPSGSVAQAADHGGDRAGARA